MRPWNHSTVLHKTGVAYTFVILASSTTRSSRSSLGTFRASVGYPRPLLKEKGSWEERKKGRKGIEEERGEKGKGGGRRGEGETGLVGIGRCRSL